LHTLAAELAKLGIKTHETASSLSVFAKSKKESFRKPILLDSQSDHRMLMAFTIAGMSGRFGEILISDPGCVAKSYPTFVSDLQRACGEKVTVNLVKRA
ncbi:MAG: hypothetical protein JRN15_21305, partial [Nitrososphaerota archaeon]|nr:hypothetical protein [Nitrososphaerota archaeon]